MKKIIILFACLTPIFAAAQSSKVVYSNAMTHFYITCYANDSIRLYAISETSTPVCNIWRLTDRDETQVLETFTQDEIRLFLSEVSDFEKTAKIGDSKEIDNILIEIKRIAGIRCIVLSNKITKEVFV